ncbi:MAG: efflux RND transporter periplasmic adaptor subunit [Myxococcota bacterium]
MRVNRAPRWLLLGLFALGCAKPSEGGAPKSGGTAKPGARKTEIPVEVEPVQASRVELKVSAVGSVEAFETVQITARVAGAVERLHFREGDPVKAGDPLMEIEPDRYRVAVESAKATTERNEAQKADAEAALHRRASVNEKSPGLVKEEEIESTRARLAIAVAAVAEAQAALHLAELNLRDAFVRAPLAGQIETRNVRTGQYVQPGTLIATLIRRDPLLLRFAVAEDQAQALNRGQKARFLVRERRDPFGANIISVAQAADSTTRMVAVVAQIEGGAELRPGSFAEIEIPVEGAVDLPVIQETAVRPSERGFLAYVVEEDVAKERIVTLGLRAGGGRVQVRSGLNPGEKLVTRGAEALRDGAKVKISAAKEGT